MTAEQKRIGRPRSCFCGECRRCKHADYMREYYRRASIEKRRAWVAGRNPLSVIRNERKRTRNQDPEFRRRESARHKARRAVKNGLIEKKACERCGSDRAQAHHEDYDKPLEVNWLCPLHHSERHRERVEEQAA